MALREMDQFNEIIDKIKNVLNWYENNHIENNKIRIFLASGDSFNYSVPRECVAHLLGIKIDFLSSCGHFKSKSSYALVKELCENQIRISGMIKDGKITLSNIFSKYVKEKIDNFKSNTNINISNTTFVCKYDKEKAHYQGKIARNCDYVIFKIEDDGTILELNVTSNGKITVPISNRVYSDENEATDSLNFLLNDQNISMISSIIVNSDYYVQNKKIYLNEDQKLLKLEILEKYKLKYKANIDIVGDCKYYYKRNQTNKREEKASYNVYEIIIDCIIKKKLIDKKRLYDLTEQDVTLINAINDTLVNSSTNDNYQASYSNLEKQIQSLKEANNALQKKNNELNNELNNTKNELKCANKEKEKALVLAKNINDALKIYNGG